MGQCQPIRLFRQQPRPAAMHGLAAMAIRFNGSGWRSGPHAHAPFFRPHQSADDFVEWRGDTGGRNRAVGGFDFRHASGHVVEQHGGSGVRNSRSEITHASNRIVAARIGSSANHSQVEHPARIFRADWRWPAMMESEAAALFTYLAFLFSLPARLCSRVACADQASSRNIERSRAMAWV